MPFESCAVAVAEALAPYRRIVVVAPHPDDDVLGCGGTIAAAAALGLALDVVYVTDGAASHRGSRSYPPHRLRATREAEARAALLRLGVGGRPRFLRWPDGTVPSVDDPAAARLLAALARVVQAAERTLVLGPWRRDPHPDHRAVAGIVARSCADAGVTHAEYYVWLDERGAHDDVPRATEGIPLVLDVAPFVARKGAALAAHRSQLGEIVHDAREAFVLPPGLIAAAAAPTERFLLAG